jgi:plastocyanin
MTAKKLMALCAAALMVFAACGDDDDDTGQDVSSTTGAPGGPQTLPVSVDTDTSAVDSAFLAYFPSEVTAHAGDTIEFTAVFTGEPHTVTFGTLVTEGMAKVTPETEEPPEELQKIPFLLPDGPGDAIQAAAQPCFLASEDPPASDACSEEQQEQPEFDGSHTYYNSGFLGDGEKFSVNLADDLEPGMYTYFCNLHREAMVGNVTVVGADEEAQTATEVEAAAAAQLDEYKTKLTPVIEALKGGAFPPFSPTPAEGTVIAGGLAQDPQSAIPVVFGPETVSVPVNSAVTWLVAGPHTVAFGASEALRTFIAKSSDGSVHVNPESFAPAGGAGQPPPDESAPPPDESAPPPPPIVIDGGSYDGTGLRNSGIILSFPPQLYSYKVTFTKAGSYEYFCLIHPDMTGTVNVTA